MASKLYNQLNNNSSRNIGNYRQQNQNNTPIMQEKKKPTIADIIQEVQESGGDARSLFFKKAHEMGVPTQPIIDYINKNG